MSLENLSTESRGEQDEQIPRLKVDSLKFGIAFALAITAIQRLIGLARSILLCRLLPDDQLGQWSLTWSYLLLLAPLAVLGLPGSFSRYVEHYRQRGQLRSFLSRIAAISLCGTIVFTATMLLFSETISRWLFRDVAQQSLVLIMALALVLVIALNFVTSLMESLRQVRLVTCMRLISGVSFAMLAVGLLLWWDASTEAVTFGFAVSCLLGIVPAAWYLSINWRMIGDSRQPLNQRTMWSRVGPFAAWLWLINIASNLFELADRNMLLHLSPVSSVEAQALVGQYHSGRVIPLMLVSVAMLLSGLLMPYLAAHWERGNKQAVSRQLRWTLKLTGLVFSFAGLMIVLMAPLLFEYLLQGKYDAGWSVLPLTLVYCIWYGLMAVGQDYLWCREQGKWACLMLTIALVANVALNYWMIPRYGLNGAVLATATSNAVGLFALYLINQRFGWRPDAGVWLTAALPLCILLPLPTGLLVFTLLAWCGVKYRWIFDDEEIIEFNQSVSSLTDRLGFSRRTFRADQPV